MPDWWRRRRIGPRCPWRVGLIKEYAQTYDTMTDAQALSLVKRWGATDQAFTNTRVNWMPKFEAVLPGKKAALFYQIDRRLSQLIDLQMMSLIPQNSVDVRDTSASG